MGKMPMPQESSKLRSEECFTDTEAGLGAKHAPCGIRKIHLQTAGASYPRPPDFFFAWQGENFYNSSITQTDRWSA